MRETGVYRLAVGGGCFMNVKLNMLIDRLAEVEDVFFCPSCGDDCLAAGAAWVRWMEKEQPTGEAFEAARPKDLYFGPAPADQDVAALLREHESEVEGRRVDDVSQAVAEHVAENRIVGRCAGRMEWGARSLGNRSVLANASDANNVRKINDAIKMRDFWMPFAPSMLWEKSSRYVVPSAHTEPAEFMILAFPSTDEAQKQLIGGLHSKDLTCRPQMVRKEVNPGYYAVLQAYERQTGHSGLINTSFNIHGEPIVCSAADAFDTFLRSGLDVLAVGDYLVTKRGRSPQ